MERSSIEVGWYKLSRFTDHQSDYTPISPMCLSYVPTLPPQYAAKNPLVWRAMYEYARFPPTRYLNEKMLALQNFGRFREAIMRYSPDMVVSVHPLCQELPLKVLSAMGQGRE